MGWRTNNGEVMLVRFTGTKSARKKHKFIESARCFGQPVQKATPQHSLRNGGHGWYAGFTSGWEIIKAPARLAHAHKLLASRPAT